MELLNLLEERRVRDEQAQQYDTDQDQDKNTAAALAPPQLRLVLDREADVRVAAFHVLARGPHLVLDLVQGLALLFRE